MNPLQVAANRSARLVAEHTAASVTYSTSTPQREHLMVIEWESDLGGRHWSKPMKASEAHRQVSQESSAFYFLSDMDHAAACWCFKEQH